MPHKENTTLKVAHTQADIKALEDEVLKIAADLKDIRVEMGEKALPELVLMPGTFKLYTGNLRKLAKRFRGELEEQIIDADVRRVQAKKAAEVEARNKKR